MSNLTRNETNLTCTPTDFPHNIVSYPVIALISSSVIACIGVLIFSTKRNHGNFFKWKLIDRISVYTAVSVLIFYLCQASQLVLLHVLHPSSFQLVILVCTPLFMEFAFAQILTSIVFAVSVLLLLLMNRSISFGKYDLKLHTLVFGIPFIVLICLQVIRMLQVKPHDCEIQPPMEFEVYFYLICGSFVILLIGYSVILIHVVKTRSQIKEVLQHQTGVNAQRLALKLSLYVGQYFVQFGGNVVVGVWRLFEEPPVEMLTVSILFVVSGGVLNGIVYVAIQRMTFQGNQSGQNNRNRLVAINNQ